MVGKLAGAGSRVAVLMGGLSAEREVSLSSGHECAKALRVAGYDVVAVDAGRDLAARLQDIKPDCAFNALHGRYGEDGCVQGLLEWLEIPYTILGCWPRPLPWTKPPPRPLTQRRACPSWRRFWHRGKMWRRVM